ncbi:MAG: sulfite exporter TauE/SafE family protein [Polyangiaceae bacterium]|nr:sulfite exporter TauE/SafE family protein [Polyangiaceae bacterium]
MSVTAETLSILVAAFSMGLFGSSHCIGMCGGVVSVVCSATGGPRSEVDSRRERIEARAGASSHWLAYNAGRIASYTFLGAVFGTIGTLSTGIFPIDGVRFVLRSLAVIGMLAVGLQLVGLPSLMRPLETAGARVWAKFSPSVLRFLPLRSPLHAFALGGAWGFMPCGLLYGAFALAASTESPSTGAMTMAAFAAGTLPVLLTMSALADRVARALSLGWVRKTAGLVVLLFGAWGSVGLITQMMPGRTAHACCTAHH